MSLLLSLSAILLLASQSSQAYTTRGHCQPVPNFCRNLTNGEGYSLMRLPNAFNNYQVDETRRAISAWNPLVGRCHAGLKLFLCAIYAPICLHDKESGKEVTIKLCRSFCLNVKGSCEPVMKQNNHSWPLHDAFNCSHYVDNSMCVREDFIAAPTTATTPKTPTTRTVKNDICDPTLHSDDDLLEKACSSDLAIRADVTSMKDAKVADSHTVLKLKRHKRTSRKSRKEKDFPDRVLINENLCSNLRNRVKTANKNGYLIFLEKRLGKKTKYIVKLILPFRNRRHKRLVKRNLCKPN